MDLVNDDMGDASQTILQLLQQSACEHKENSEVSAKCQCNSRDHILLRDYHWLNQHRR